MKPSDSKKIAARLSEPGGDVDFVASLISFLTMAREGDAYYEDLVTATTRELTAAGVWDQLDAKYIKQAAYSRMPEGVRKAFIQSLPKTKRLDLDRNRRQQLRTTTDAIGKYWNSAGAQKVEPEETSTWSLAFRGAKAKPTLPQVRRLGLKNPDVLCNAINRVAFLFDEGAPKGFVVIRKQDRYLVKIKPTKGFNWAVSIASFTDSDTPSTKFYQRKIQAVAEAKKAAAMHSENASGAIDSQRIHPQPLISKRMLPN